MKAKKFWSDCKECKKKDEEVTSLRKRVVELSDKLAICQGIANVNHGNVMSSEQLREKNDKIIYNYTKENIKKCYNILKTRI